MLTTSVTRTTTTATTTRNFATTTSSGAGGFVEFVSGEDWTSYPDAVPAQNGPPVPRGPNLGPARDVCLTPTTPPDCPNDAVVFGNPSTLWSASQAIGGAHWIWRGDVSAGAPADLQTAAFQQRYAIGAHATGVMHLAADDQADVYLNGMFAGSSGSVSNFQTASESRNRWTAIGLPIDAVAPAGGTIVITVIAQNGPASFGTGCPPAGCDYSQNPAGVLFSGDIVW